MAGINRCHLLRIREMAGRSVSGNRHFLGTLTRYFRVAVQRPVNDCDFRATSNRTVARANQVSAESGAARLASAHYLFQRGRHPRLHLAC